MAKKYHTNVKTRGAKAVNKGVIGIIITLLIAALLLGAAVGVLGYGTSGFKDWGFSRFAHKNPAALEDVENDIPDMGSSTIIEQKENNGMAMLSRQATLDEVRFYAPVAMQENPENVFQLSVTYEPAETTFQETDYTIAFKNPGSEWATGKNVQDYVQLTHVDGSKEATITILQAFSEQIIVTARSQRYSNIFAKTTVDYVCEYLSIDIEQTVFQNIDDDMCLTDYEWYNGTIEPEITNHVYFSIDFSDGFVKHMQSKGFTVNQTYERVISDPEYAESHGVNGDDIMNFLSALYGASDYYNLGTRKSAFEKACAQFFKDCGEGTDCWAGCYNFRFDRYYNGKNYGAGTCGGGDLYVKDLNIYFEIEPNGMNSNTPGVVGG